MQASKRHASAVASPPSRSTPVRLGASDGWTLCGRLLAPSEPPLGVIVAGHAMMVDSRTIYRRRGPSLAQTLVEAGFLVLVVDLRGHGQSEPRAAAGGRWSYHDLVDDVGVYIHWARQRFPQLPLALVGHSLFGHVALAYLSRVPQAEVAAVVAMGAHIWNPRFARRWWRRPLQRMIMAGSRALGWAWGYVPIVSLRAGSTDEALPYWQDLSGFVFANGWTAPDGFDYRANLGTVRVPVLHVISRGDRWIAPPEEAMQFSAPLPRRELMLLGDESQPAAAPTHMSMVTRANSAPLWQEVAFWLRRRLARQ